MRVKFDYYKKAKYTWKNNVFPFYYETIAVLGNAAARST